LGVSTSDESGAGGEQAVAATPNTASGTPLGAIRKAWSILRRPILAVTGPWTRNNALTWLVLILAVLAVRWLLFEPYKIPSGSMEPTLHGDMRIFRGDRVGVNKVIYGPRVPFMNKRIFHLAEPKRWDVVVFKTVQKNAIHKTLVKRVVGLPGERIHIKDGKIWVNGEPVEPPESLRGILHYTSALEVRENDLNRFILYMAHADSLPFEAAPGDYTLRRFLEELGRVRERLGARRPDEMTPEEAKSLAGELTPSSRDIVERFFRTQQEMQYPLRYGVLEDDEHSLAPKDCYLVCGDNSPDSADGRIFGWLPNDNILGRAFCICWPPSRIRDLTGFSKTWWGMSLLYGIPALLVAYETISWIRRRRVRRASAN